MSENLPLGSTGPAAVQRIEDLLCERRLQGEGARSGKEEAKDMQYSRVEWGSVLPVLKELV